MTDYTLDKLDILIEIFKHHSDEYDKNFSNQSPEFYNLPKALIVMCREIKELKQKIKNETQSP